LRPVEDGNPAIGQTHQPDVFHVVGPGEEEFQAVQPPAAIEFHAPATAAVGQGNGKTDAAQDQFAVPGRDARVLEAREHRGVRARMPGLVAPPVEQHQGRALREPALDAARRKCMTVEVERGGDVVHVVLADAGEWDLTGGAGAGALESKPCE
jgi:hypothetical protein